MQTIRTIRDIDPILRSRLLELIQFSVVFYTRHHIYGHSYLIIWNHCELVNPSDTKLNHFVCFNTPNHLYKERNSNQYNNEHLDLFRGWVWWTARARRLAFWVGCIHVRVCVLESVWGGGIGTDYFKVQIILMYHISWVMGWWDIYTFLNKVCVRVHFASTV